MLAHTDGRLRCFNPPSPGVTDALSWRGEKQRSTSVLMQESRALTRGMVSATLTTNRDTRCPSFRYERLLTYVLRHTLKRSLWEYLDPIVWRHRRVGSIHI